MCAHHLIDTYIYKQSKQSCSVMSDSLRPPRAVAYQSPLSMGFSRQEYWSGLPFPSPGDLPDPGIEPRSPTLQADTLPSEPPMVHVQTDEKGVVGILCICFQGGVTTHTTQHVWAWSCILSFSWSLILLSSSSPHNLPIITFLFLFLSLTTVGPLQNVN